MAGESARVLVRLFAFQRHRGGRDLYRLARSEEHTSELQSRSDLVCRLLLEKKKKTIDITRTGSQRNKRIRFSARYKNRIGLHKFRVTTAPPAHLAPCLSQGCTPTQWRLTV